MKSASGCPSCLKSRLHATVKDVTDAPFVVFRNTGSFVNLPTNTTLLIMIVPPIYIFIKLLDRHRPGLFEVFLYEIEDLGKSFIMDPSHHLDVLPDTIASTEQVSQHDDVSVYTPLMISLHFDIPLL